MPSGQDPPKGMGVSGADEVPPKGIGVSGAKEIPPKGMGVSGSDEVSPKGMVVSGVDEVAPKWIGVSEQSPEQEVKLSPASQMPLPQRSDATEEVDAEDSPNGIGVSGQSVGQKPKFSLESQTPSPHALIMIEFAGLLDAALRGTHTIQFPEQFGMPGSPQVPVMVCMVFGAQSMPKKRH